MKRKFNAIFLCLLATFIILSLVIAVKLNLNSAVLMTGKF